MENMYNMLKKNMLKNNVYFDQNFFYEEINEFIKFFSELSKSIFLCNQNLDNENKKAENKLSSDEDEYPFYSKKNKKQFDKEKIESNKRKNNDNEEKLTDYQSEKEEEIKNNNKKENDENITDKKADKNNLDIKEENNIKENNSYKRLVMEENLEGKKIL